jgi:predicted nucleic-acid-binding protein
VSTIPIESISIKDSRRPLRGVSELAASIREVGLLNPITVTREHRLIAGYHRLEACKSLGWSEIPANVVTLSEADAELAEIDENLIRNDLTVLDRAEQLLRRKRLYEEKYPETRKGVAGGKARQGSASEIISFADDAAARMDVTRRTVQQEVQIAQNIPAAVRDAIRGTFLANDKTTLLELSRARPEVQQKIAERARGHKNVAFFCEYCLALETIRDLRLYSNEHATFEDYLKIETEMLTEKQFNEFLEIAHELADIFVEQPLHSMENPQTTHMSELRSFWNRQAA